ncbi:PUS1, partial [Symbiodinium necroappetens]
MRFAGRGGMGRTFGGVAVHELDELLPPPTPLTHRSTGAAEGPRSFVGACSFQNQGKNGENQDSWIAAESGSKSLLAVLDGHGEQGKRVSEYARSQLARSLYDSKDLYTKPASALQSAYAETQKGIERSHAIDAQRSGTTAVTCYRHRDKLVVANVGDSRAVLGRCSSREGDGSLHSLRAVDLSSDQRPMREDERNRILQQGGAVHPSAMPMRQGFGPPVLVRVGPERDRVLHHFDLMLRCRHGGSCETRVEMISDDLSRALQGYAHLSLCRSDSTCTGCGEKFATRNALFRHLRQHGCGGGTRRHASRSLLLYGYVGTRFHGSQLNSVQSEAKFPTVEGCLLPCIEAALRKQPDVTSVTVEVASRASRTDRGVHALSTALCLRITKELCSSSENTMNPDNTSSFLELLRSELPPELTAAHVFDVDDPQFNARFACQKREYWYYVPYRALFTRREQERMKLLWSNAGAFPGEDALASWIWVSGLPTEATKEDLTWTIQEVSARHKLAVVLEDVVFSRKDGSAKLKFSDSSCALAACAALDGFPGPQDAQGHRAPLLALPESLLEAWQSVHRRLRSALKKLTGTRSFHNFSPGFEDAKADPRSVRSVYRCRAGVTAGYRDYLEDKAFAVLRITGRDFLYHQIRSMVGVVIAVTNSSLPESHLDLALSDETGIQVPLAPASHLVLAECVFRDGLFGCPFGQAVREAKDKVSERMLSSKDKVLILGSDGVWDRLNSQEAVDIAARHTDPNAAAREIASIARQRWHAETQGQLSDDITA